MSEQITEQEWQSITVLCQDHGEEELADKLKDCFAQLEAERDDARIVAKFIIGWWPGLEDALSWPVDEPYEDDRRYAAAKRIVDAAALSEQEEE